jgi:hypothetical protein
MPLPTRRSDVEESLLGLNGIEQIEYQWLLSRAERGALDVSQRARLSELEKKAREISSPPANSNLASDEVVRIGSLIVRYAEPAPVGTPPKGWRRTMDVVSAVMARLWPLD